MSRSKHDHFPRLSRSETETRHCHSETETRPRRDRDETETRPRRDRDTSRDIQLWAVLRKWHGRTQEGPRCHGPPFSLCNMVLKPNSLSIISQTNNGCSPFSHILAKLLLLDITSENVFALSIVTASGAATRAIGGYKPPPH